MKWQIWGMCLRRPDFSSWKNEIAEIDDIFVRRDLYEGKYAPDPEGESRWLFVRRMETILLKSLICLFRYLKCAQKSDADCFIFRYLSEGGSCVLGSNWKIEELQYMIQFYTQDRMFRVELWFSPLCVFLIIRVLKWLGCTCLTWSCSTPKIEFSLLSCDSGTKFL